MRTLLITTLAAASLATSAAQAAPWSAPTALGPAGDAASVPALSFARAAKPALSWRITDSIRFPQFPAAIHKPLVISTGQTGRTVRSVAAGPIAYGKDSTLSVRKTIVGRASTVTPVRLGWSVGSVANNAVGTAHTLGTYRLDGEPALAVDAATGNAVLVWAEYRDNQNDRVWLSRRSGSGRFTTPKVIRGTGQISGLSAAVNNQGSFVVVWNRFTRAGGAKVEARTGTYVRGVTALTQVLGPGSDVTTTAAGSAANGRLTVAWTTQDGGEELNTPLKVYGAVRPAGRSAFGAAQVLDTSGPGIERPDGDISMAVSSTTAVIGYTLSGGYDSVHDTEVTPVKAVGVDIHGRFEAPQQLAATGHNGTVAMRSDGTALIPVLVPGAVDSSAVLAAVRPAETPSFSLAPVGNASGPEAQAAAAFDAAGNAALLWTAAKTVQYASSPKP